MSQHGCPERLSNRSKGFQDDGPSQPTMEVLVETLTGTAFEMTVLPTDTVFAIKSKIFRVEGIPVSQQHLLYNLKELDDATSLREHSIGDGARLRLVLGMRGGPISTRRLPPPPNAEPWRDIERLLDTNRDDVEWGGSGCKVTVLVFRDGERVNMLRVKENNDGTYSPLEHNKYSSSSSSSLTALVERGGGAGSSTGSGPGSLHDNAVTMGKMLELRRRMESLSVQRSPTSHSRNDKVEIQKTRSEETLSVPSLLDECATEGLKQRAVSYAPYSDDESFAPLYDGNYTRYDYDCAFSDRYTLLPPIGTRAESEHSIPEDSERIKLSDTLAGSILVKGRREAADDAAILEECLDTDDCQLRQDSPELTAKNLAPIQAAECGPLVCGGGASEVGSVGSVGGVGGAWGGVGGVLGRGAHSAHGQRRAQPLAAALFSSSTSDLENLKRNSTHMLPALSRHRPREHLHLSDERLECPPDPPSSERAPPAPPGSSPPAAGSVRASRPRCLWCRKRLSICSVHRCRCGGAYCAPHRYAEVHGCAYDYRAATHDNTQPLRAHKLPRI